MQANLIPDESAAYKPLTDLADAGDVDAMKMIVRFETAPRNECHPALHDSFASTPSRLSFVCMQGPAGRPETMDEYLPLGGLSLRQIHARTASERAVVASLVGITGCGSADPNF